jgi:phospholipid/cholesterol/gamma-HCH transport system substrate-binding protein
MSRIPTELKVGIFVVVTLVLLGALILSFSKGTPFYVATYDIHLRAEDVGGVRIGAGILMAGVPIGNVRDIALEKGGRTVLIQIRILQRFRIPEDSTFSIQQYGFLGDQYIAVVPGDSPVMLEDGDVALADQPFNIQEVARSAVGLIQKVDRAAASLNLAIERLDETLFAEENLTNLTVMVSNFRLLSEQALATVSSVDSLVDLNSHPLSLAVSNLVLFSEQLNGVADELQIMVATNRNEFNAAVKHIESTSSHLEKITGGLQEGRGAVGLLLRDPETEREFRQTMHNIHVLSSNLNQHGVLWRPRRDFRTPADTLYPGRSPF